jgi:hypothetical protein
MLCALPCCLVMVLFLSIHFVYLHTWFFLLTRCFVLFCCNYVACPPITRGLTTVCLQIRIFRSATGLRIRIQILFLAVAFEMLFFISSSCRYIDISLQRWHVIDCDPQIRKCLKLSLVCDPPIRKCFYEPEPPFMHVTDCCWFLISGVIELYRGGGPK